LTKRTLASAGISSKRTLLASTLIGSRRSERAEKSYERIDWPGRTSEGAFAFAGALHAGAFGESFTLTGADEKTVCLGDIIRVGSCHLQLSEPGQPDQWLYSSPRIKIIEAAKRTHRTGWYYRIIEPGWVTAGDSVVLVKRPNPSWSVARFSQILGAEDPTRKELAELTTLKGLASYWQWAAGKALKGVEQSLALFRGH
jgi:MOSC domain-containing protein YiiM